MKMDDDFVIVAIRKADGARTTSLYAFAVMVQQMGIGKDDTDEKEKNHLSCIEQRQIEVSATR